MGASSPGRSMTARKTCCVPFCRRTTGRDPSSFEWICGDHWRLVDRRLKSAWRRQLKRRYAVWYKANAAYLARDAEIVAEADPRGIHNNDPAWALIDAEKRAAGLWWSSYRLWWKRIKDQAIERAAGIIS